MKESAKTVAMQHGDKYNDFVASDGWLNRFLLRKDLALRAKTSVSQRLPKDLVPKVINFLLFVHWVWATNPDLASNQKATKKMGKKNRNRFHLETAHGNITGLITLITSKKNCLLNTE